MKRNAWNKPHAEEMRQRFLECGIAVNDLEPEEAASGLLICPNPSLFDCRATLDPPGNSRYTLSLRLLSDNPNRVISAFRITSEWEKEIRVLEPSEPVPHRFVDWDSEERILNNCLGQAVGPTRCREGLLLAEGLKTPITNGRTTSPSVVVWVYDQFDQVYCHNLEVHVVGLYDLLTERRKPRKARESLFAHPLDVPEYESTRGTCAEDYRLEVAASKRKLIPPNSEWAPLQER